MDPNAAAAAAAAYEPVIGMPTYDQLDQAWMAFDRLDVNEDAPPMLVATRVPQREWFKKVYFKGVKSGGCPSHDATPVPNKGIDHVSTNPSCRLNSAEDNDEDEDDDNDESGCTCIGEDVPMDVYIVQGGAKSVKAYPRDFFRRQLQEVASRDILTIVGRIDIPLVDGGFVQTDFSTYPSHPPAGESRRDVRPRALFEIDTDNRRFEDAHSRCKDFFRFIPSVRVVVLIKFFLRYIDNDNTFAAVAVQYGRRARDSGCEIVDAVSFGTAALDVEYLALLNEDEEQAIGFQVRELPIPDPAVDIRTTNPWTRDPAASPEVIDIDNAARACNQLGRVLWALEWNDVDLRFAFERGDQEKIDKCKAFRDSTAARVHRDFKAATKAVKILECRKQTPAGPFLFLRSADVFDGARLANGNPVYFPAWQSVCFIDLWQVLSGLPYALH